MRTPEIPVEEEPAVPPHGLLRSVVLHLLPGAALTAFVLAAAPVVEELGLPALFAFFVGIGLVIVPLELGYLAVTARRTTGSWSPLGAVGYRRRLRPRTYVLGGVALFLWFTVFSTASMLLLDEWIADNLFGWMPETLLQFSRVDDDAALSTAALLLVLAAAFTFNGVLGPIVEELYFRGHLLPRLSRLGRWAPVLNTVLFSVYHLWTPWTNPARIIGFLPITWAVWRTRSVYLGVVAHVLINTVFLVLLTALVLGGEA
ncbi:CPBP family intramembrane glutamic endopeptidase [Trujillonella humicola]|uniref:CPBP family intramembrane glutamic endopeptidase n=1 Tax=Trujillonella humicola TaxID=3383699 RepID=UPI003906661F